MQHKVKDRLQQLIRNLAEDEGGSESFNATAAEQPAAVESEASIGLSELVTDTSTSRATSNGSGAGSAGAEHADLRHLPAGLQRQAELEAKVVALLQERKQAAVRHERELRQKEADMARLQQYIDNELQDLQHRQQQVEQRAPLLQVQVAEARNALRDLTISDCLYAELEKVPDDQLTLVDAVKMAMHDHVHELKHDNERLRLSLASSREAAQRLEREKGALQRENGRLAADLADHQGQVDGTVSSLQARCERLSAELEEAAVQVEVLNAKGQMYDDLQAKADRMAEELERLHGALATAQRLQQQLEDADSRSREREHTLELLMLDKAYLSKEVELLNERLAAADTQLKAKSDKVAALKTAKAQLQEKLSEVEASARQAADGKLSAELARLTAQAAADVDRVRREASEAYDRDTRMLRDLRDQAQAEAEAARAASREAKALQEETAAAAREAAARMDARCAELAGEVKLKAYEAQRLQVLADERAASLAEAQLQLVLLTDKVAVLTDNLYSVEAAGSKAASELRLQLEAAQTELEGYRAADANVERTIVAAATELGTDPESADRRLLELLPTGPSSGLAATMQRRVQHNLALAARCARLEAERSALARDREDVARQLQEARAQLVVAQQRLRHVGQPHGFLLEQLQAAEERARAAEADVKQLEEALQSKDTSVREATEEKAALRRDLERILKERGALDSMRRLVLTALGSAQPSGHQVAMLPAASTAMLQAGGAPRAIILDQRGSG